jgi:prophage regulatory protein
MEDNEKIDRFPDVIRMSGLSRSSILRLVKLRQFPAPIQLSDRAIGWKHDEILRWQASRVSR